MAKRHLLLGLFLGIAMGCATAPVLEAPAELGEAVRTRLSNDPLIEPIQGPGTTFETIDEAAIDGLAWCYLKSRGERPVRVRGGSVRPVPSGGYAYDEIATARAIRPYRLWIRVEPTDVAYFIHVPGPGSRENESHSRVHRANVDRRDPLHRPSYLLTPRLRVQVYRGAGEELRLAVLDRSELRELVRRAERR